VSLPEGFNDVEISERASEQKILLWPLSRYYAGKWPLHGFVLGFGSTTAEQIPTAVRRMRAIVLGQYQARSG
jgi:GntR family transcriptional regulator / MocR family aminotransferase